MSNLDYEVNPADLAGDHVFIVRAVPRGREPELVRAQLVGVPIRVLAEWHTGTASSIDFKADCNDGDVVTALTEDVVHSLEESHHTGAARSIERHYLGQVALHFHRELGELLVAAS